MRNGNKTLEMSWRNLIYVLILPMRNGNLFLGKVLVLFLKSFYPTYEEWKHLFCLHLGWIRHSFYPTYEEWKRLISDYNKISKRAFYPTYEEWKRNIKCYYVMSNYLFILPMRNGNISIWNSSWTFATLFILPMRNGNILKFSGTIFLNSFLSYLWGMETREHPL